VILIPRNHVKCDRPLKNQFVMPLNLQLKGSCQVTQYLMVLARVGRKWKFEIEDYYNGTSTVTSNTISNDSISTQSSRSVKFANECFERSRERRRKSLGRTNFLIVPKKSFSSNSSTSSISSKTSSITALSEDSLLHDDIHQTSLLRRVEEMKRKIKAMKVRYYHQKCIRSLERCRVLYMNIDTSSNYGNSIISYNDSFSESPVSSTNLCSSASNYDSYNNIPDSSITVCSTTSSINKTFSNKRIRFHKRISFRTAKLFSQVAKEVICLNLIFATIWMIFLMYKNILFETNESLNNFI